MQVSLTPIRRKTKKVIHASQILETVKRKLKYRKPSFARALSQLKMQPVREEIGICTDGVNLYYNPGQVISKELYQIERILCRIALYGALGHFKEPQPFTGTAAAEGLCCGDRYSIGLTEESDPERRFEGSKGTALTFYEFLLREIISVSEALEKEDDLDKTLYTYGLEMYGDVPLVEPEECSEVRKINTLVIALDTSGSCRERIPLFLREVKKLFLDIQDKFEADRVCLLQCDSQIQKETVYHDLYSFMQEADRMEICGGGGTDFTPVCRRVGELQKTQTVDALFYLTDAKGRYPEDEKISCPVYFLVTPEDIKDKEEVPEWVKLCPVISAEG